MSNYENYGSSKYVHVNKSCEHRKYEFNDIIGCAWSTCLSTNEKCVCGAPPKDLEAARRNGCIHDYKPKTEYKLNVKENVCGNCNICTPMDTYEEAFTVKAEEVNQEVIIRKHYNGENNWLLIESRVFDHKGTMLNANLDVLDLSNLHNKVPYIDDVWVYDWTLIEESKMPFKVR